MSDGYERKGLEYLAETLVFNTFSRLLGAFVRLTLLIMGSLTLCVFSVVLWLILIVWTLLPVISLGCVIAGIIFITL